MRFDGYFLLCDWLDMPNLHARAFAMGRWWLRKVLFGWVDSPPELFKPRRQAFLVVFALTTWLYRLSLFLGIAYLVYDSVFKLLGIVLLFIELYWFIALPIFREFQAWWRRRDELEWNRATGRSAFVLVCLVLFCVVPWKRDVRAPGVLGAAQSQELYAVAAARVVEVRASNGAGVRAGEVLMRLEAPDLTHQLAVAESKSRSLRAQVDRQPFDDKLLQEGAALRERWATAEADVAGLKSQVDQLLVRAPFDGHAVDLNDMLAPGAWVAAHERLVHVTGLNDGKGEVLVDEADLSRLTPGEAYFVAERAEEGRVSCRLGAVDRINLTGPRFSLSGLDLRGRRAGSGPGRQQRRPGADRDLVSEPDWWTAARAHRRRRSCGERPICRPIR